MTVVSLLLILVAVTLLVLGLTGGSSGLLIGSIVASLLAAVLLVVGARQAAAARRGVSAREPEDPFPAGPFASEPLVPAPDDDAVFVAEPEFAAAAEEARRHPGDDSRDTVMFDPAADRRDTVQFDPDDLAAAWPSAGPDFSAVPAEPLADQAGAAPRGDLSADDPGVDDADYDRASAAINSARSASDPFPEPDADIDDGAGAGAFAEPDADDPDDEPLPQAVQPADAVRIARLDAEVLVVDGRPRYHLADCPSLAGRATEPIPVNEAVELGFSPCGLCRPVDRLVGAAARR
ncbi:hypothetical protein [Actinoplanes sp. URMC 104]|uniref:hypothetical protein n=1 Tax=Actinoplanes sp. URMC 104 TaxID=3423409 RepID=UPI003F1C2E79